jgi:hypothetical protein
MACIIVTSGDGIWKYYPLGLRTSVIGRDEADPIQIIDEHVSRKHLQIRYDKQGDEYLASRRFMSHGNVEAT